jgi:hypothetical protein
MDYIMRGAIPTGWDSTENTNSDSFGAYAFTLFRKPKFTLADFYSISKFI